MHDVVVERRRDPQTVRELRDLIKSDIDAHRARVQRVLPILFPSVFAGFLYRVSHFCRRRGMSITPRILTWLMIATCSCEIDPEAVIGPGFQMVHTLGAGIGPQVRAGSNLRVYNGVLIGARSLGRGGMPSIGDDVCLYSQSGIYGGITIGDRAVIGAQTLVLTDVEDDEVVLVPPTPTRGHRPPS